MGNAPPQLPARIERYRNYLHMLARCQLTGRLRAKVDPSDVVQVALTKAVERQEQFRGQTDAELAGWLRRILANTMTDAVRKNQREQNVVITFEEGVDASSARLEAWLAADQSSPSEQVERQEQLLSLASALAGLPEDQRVVVELHHIQGMAVADVAAQLGRTPASVAGLLRRGLKALRETMAAEK
jgi:RNA polymerase sigma-70 factor (ECF subfamily)